MKSPKVYAIILNWRSPEDTVRCLTSLKRSTYPNLEALVVHNGPPDQSLDFLLKHHPDVPVLANGRNLGYAGGNNSGIRHAVAAGADYVWLLNDDVTVAADSLSIMIDAVADQATIGFVGPLVGMSDEPERILSAGGILDRDGQGCHRGLGETDRGQYPTVQAVDYVMGCSILVRCSIVQSIGMLDEDFFAYHEEIDWCYRGREAGYPTVFVPQARVWHPDTRARDHDSAIVTYYITRNHLLFLRKHRLGHRAMLRTLGQDLVWLLNWSLNPKWRAIRRKRNALWWGVVDFLRGRFGAARRPL